MTQTIDFSHFTSIRIGPIAEVLIIEDTTYPPDHTIIGHGYNVLIGPNPPPLMMLSKAFDYIKIENGTLIVGGATPSGKVVSFAKKHNLAHFEFLLKLPGTMGGMVAMNAGLKSWEIFNHLKGIVTKNGFMPKSQIAYSYRHTNITDVVFEAHFEIHQGFDPAMVQTFLKMRDNQPLSPSAGSCFVNPKGDFAGRLIEAVGLKGYQIGNMAFSSEHANFLINLGGGTFEEAISLIEEAKRRVLKQHNIALELEIKVLEL